MSKEVGIKLKQSLAELPCVEEKNGADPIYSVITN